MKPTVLLFAAARQLAAADRVELEVGEGATVAELREKLGEAFPALKPLLAHVSFAVNNTYASDSTTLTANDEIACIPPVSGG